MDDKYDFSGYATKNNLLCSDGRVICKDAFKDNDGTKVPLVWQHVHDNPMNVIGHAVLENRSDGVYAYGYFNDTDNAKQAKALVQHGDITSLSIYANRLTQDGRNVTHGVIREVSLVYAGANPGATIENLGFSHADGSFEESDEAVIYTGEELSMEHEIKHADDEKQEEKSSDDRTVQDVFDTLNEEQKKVVYFLIGQALEDAGVSNDEAEHGEEEDMKKNIFETEDNTNVLSHSEMEAIFTDAKRNGSLKEAVLEHGITDIDILFPEAQLTSPTPEMVTRPMEWVAKVWNGTHKSRFARIKTNVTDGLTRDEARARGYIKGHQKVEEQFGLLYRKTTPQTVYKLQKLDRDDVIDITDFDVVAWLKAEMRMMLNEELARAIMIGDGRVAGTEYKIEEDHIRPIYQDEDLYTIHKQVEIDDEMDSTDRSNAIVDAALRARKDYRGSGAPKFYASPDTITDLLLAKDKMGRRIYNTIDELANALRVTEIVEIPLFEGVTRTEEIQGVSHTYDLLGIIVNLNDYTVGADKGGEVSMFDDFDLNYNKYEYLIETRCSGALTKPYSAIALEVVNP